MEKEQLEIYLNTALNDAKLMLTFDLDFGDTEVACTLIMGITKQEKLPLPDNQKYGILGSLRYYAGMLFRRKSYAAAIGVYRVVLVSFSRDYRCCCLFAAHGKI